VRDIEIRVIGEGEVPEASVALAPEVQPNLDDSADASLEPESGDPEGRASKVQVRPCSRFRREPELGGTGQHLGMSPRFGLDLLKP
jgi:hypothetical protein